MPSIGGTLDVEPTATTTFDRLELVRRVVVGHGDPSPARDPPLAAVDDGAVRLERADVARVVGLGGDRRAG